MLLYKLIVLVVGITIAANGVFFETDNEGFEILTDELTKEEHHIFEKTLGKGKLTEMTNAQEEPPKAFSLNQEAKHTENPISMPTTQLQTLKSVKNTKSLSDVTAHSTPSLRHETEVATLSTPRFRHKTELTRHSIPSLSHETEVATHSTPSLRHETKGLGMTVESSTKTSSVEKDEVTKSKTDSSISTLSAEANRRLQKFLRLADYKQVMLKLPKSRNKKTPKNNSTYESATEGTIQSVSPTSLPQEVVHAHYTKFTNVSSAYKMDNGSFTPYPGKNYEEITFLTEKAFVGNATSGGESVGHTAEFISLIVIMTIFTYVYIEVLRYMEAL